MDAEDAGRLFSLELLELRELMVNVELEGALESARIAARRPLLPEETESSYMLSFEFVVGLQEFLESGSNVRSGKW